MACLRIVLAVFVAVLTATTSADFGTEKCPIEEKDLQVLAECLAIVRPDIDLQTAEPESLIFDDEDTTKLAVCHYKKDGLMSDDGEYFEEKTIQTVNETKMDKSVKEEIIKGIKDCGAGKDHKTEGRAILLCSSRFVEKVCFED